MTLATSAPQAVGDYDDALPLSRFARRARRVLDAEAVIVTARPGDEDTPAILAASPADSDALRKLAVSNRLHTFAELSHGAVSRPATSANARWLVVGVADDTRDLATLQVRYSPDRVLGTRVEQLLRFFADDLVQWLTMADGRPAAAPPAEDLIAARTLTELALTVQTYEELVGAVTAVVAPLVEAAKAGIAIWHPERGYLEMLPGSFAAGDDVTASARVSGSEAGSLAARVVATGRASFSNRAAAELPLFRDLFAAMGIAQMLTLPVVAPGRTIGVLHLANKDAGFSDADISRLAGLMPFIATLVDSVRGRQELRARGEIARVVSSAATAVAAGLPLSDFAGFLEEFCAAIRAQMLIISFSDGAPQIDVLKVQLDAESERTFRAESARGTRATRTSMEPPQAAGDRGRATLHVPVLIGGKHKATLSVLRIPYEPFVDYERNAIRRLAEVSALGWATEQHQRERAQLIRLRERQRIADDLHDHVAQILFSGQLTVQSVVEQLGDDATLLPPLVRARDLLVRGQCSIRDVIEQLSTANAKSLPGRLAELVQNVEDEFDIAINLDVSSDRIQAAERASYAAASAALNAAREGIVNAAKHGRPCRIWVRMRVTGRGRLVLTVDDNGVGIARTPRREGYGLRSVRRKLAPHGGTLRLSKSERGGTRFLVSLPLDAGRRA